MPTAPAEVNRATPARPQVPNSWQMLRTELNQLFDRFGFSSETRLAMPSPAVDIVEEPNRFKLTAEVPGMSGEDIEVTVSGGMLVLKGEKKQESERTDKNYSLSERSYGAFRRAFDLPEGVDRDQIAAEFSKGVLTITLPKTAAAPSSQTKRIDVKAAA
jgi:HSP20 family protein